MEELQFIDPYVPLPRPGAGTIHLDHQFYERTFEERTGLPDHTGIKRARDMVPIFSCNGNFTFEDLQLCLTSAEVTQWRAKRNRTSTPLMNAFSLGCDDACAMQLSSPAELETHMLFAYQITAAHYALGSTFMEQNFPHFCCGRSSRNVAFNLIHRGYINTVLGTNLQHNHAYVLLPFVLGPDKKNGVILIDPTAKQTFRSGIPRVLVEAKFEPWEYITDWENGANLYPQHISVFNPEQVEMWGDRFTSFEHVWTTTDPFAFFSKAYKNIIAPPTVIKK